MKIVNLLLNEESMTYGYFRERHGDTENCQIEKHQAIAQNKTAFHCGRRRRNIESRIESKAS